MAPRIAMAVLVFFVALNGFSWVMIETGTAEFYGLDAPDNNCTDEVCIEDPDERGDYNVSTGVSDGETLFGQITGAARDVTSLFNKVFPALAMLERFGVPWYITSFLGSMISLVGTIAVIFFVRGY